MSAAARYGAKGLVVYPDPFLETAEGEGVFPDTRWLPGSAVRRFSVLQRMGDPLTPGYAATGRPKEEEAESKHPNKKNTETKKQSTRRKEALSARGVTFRDL